MTGTGLAVPPPARTAPCGQSATSVGKALRLLDAFMVIGPVARVSELAQATGLPKSTVFRLLNSLQLAGYIVHSGTDYLLNLRLFELGSLVEVCRPEGLRAIAAPFLADLYRDTAHTAHLAVLDGTDVLYIEKVHGRGGRSLPTSVGGRMPASCTALGKAMLPFGYAETAERIARAGLVRLTPRSVTAPGLFLGELRGIRQSGAAFDREESALGLTCVAAPVRYRERAIAAISLSGPTSRLDPDRLAARVRDAAARISALHARTQAARAGATA